MIFAEAHHLVEADRHIFDAHQHVRQQREIVTELKVNGQPSSAADELCALMNLMLPIFEDLRQHILVVLSSDR
jgi:hypothetical protein